VVDRVSDTLVLGGVAWYLASTHPGHIAVLPLALVGASTLVSYERARAESLGFTARGGLMERAERMLALGACLVFSAVMVPILWLMLVLTGFTACQRFVMVWRQAGAVGPAKPKPTLAGVTGRWRGWTPGGSSGPAPRGKERPRWGTGATGGSRSATARRRPRRP
jgi:CDP-diacylglycerol--glycerol-3-phosphate 3-phosphatidyltransferase